MAILEGQPARRKPPQTVHLGIVSVTRETKKAIEVKFADGTSHWVPKSQIVITESDIAGGAGPLVVRAWWAEVALGIER